MREYERLTNQKWSEDIDLTQELGYSHIYKRLYEFEEKIENGTLVELPCKVGDTVYKVEREYSYSNDTYFWHIVEKPFELGMLDYWWGKMIFLTKAEAEAKWRELEGERECR